MLLKITNDMWSKFLLNTIVAGGSFLFFSCVTSEPNNKIMSDNISTVAFTGSTGNEAAIDTATFGAGCFWCVEAIFQQVEGVLKVTSGYCGGHVVNPTYEQVNTKTTGHAEVAQIVFDPKKISFDELLEIFWQTHDPTTLNRQGNDIGTQYRSEIFYHNENQKQLSLEYISILNHENTFGKPVVTQVSLAPIFYPAETYHSNYYNLNKTQSYCNYVITPKMEKLKKVYSDKLKK